MAKETCFPVHGHMYTRIYFVNYALLLLAVSAQYITVCFTRLYNGL